MSPLAHCPPSRKRAQHPYQCYSEKRWNPAVSLLSSSNLGGCGKARLQIGNHFSVWLRTCIDLNSVIDWPFNFKLHGLMVANPSWRLKNRNGSDLILHPMNQWGYNLSNPELRSAWVDECVAAAKAGCTGCFIDQANVRESVRTWPENSSVVKQYSAAHLAGNSKNRVDRSRRESVLDFTAQ